MFYSNPLAWLLFMPLSALTFPLSSVERRYTESLSFDDITPSTDLSWYTCYDSGYECALLDVPLDYGKPDGYRAYVPIIRYLANTTVPYMGMALYNPGGPGGSGVDFVAGYGAQYHEEIGEGYDIVGWEPRGIGYSIPSANCTKANVQRKTKRYELSHGPLVSLEEIFRDSAASSLELAKACAEIIGGEDGAGMHMSTETVARDMISIQDAFAASPDADGVEDATVVNYMGYSYGTTLGMTFASMFPERVGRIVLDGVDDSDDAISGLPMRNLMSTDENFATFFVYCSIAGDKCSFNTGGTAGDIFFRFERILAKLDTNIADDLKWDNITEIDSALFELKSSIFSSLYSPKDGFPDIADMLLDTEESLNDRSPTAEKVKRAINPPKKEIDGSDSWYTAVMCTDNANSVRNMTEKEMDPYVNVLRQQSYIGGEVLAAGWIGCLGWTIEASRRFAGPFGGPTKNPILLVGNSWDPITPGINAHKASMLFSDSQVLTVNEPGHCNNNKCSLAKMKAYMQNGTMPGADNFCDGLEENFGPWDTTLNMRMEDNGAWRSIVARLRKLRLKTYEVIEFNEET